MIQILGVGLSRTGTMSLTTALQILGLKARHFDRGFAEDYLFGKIENLQKYIVDRYTEVDVVTDIITCCLYEEFRQVFKECKYILTVRDSESWFESYKNLVTDYDLNSVKCSTRELKRRKEIAKIREFVYGCSMPIKDVWIKKFEEHIQRCKKEIPSKDLLVMNIFEGDSWDKLCGFLNVEKPLCKFPHISPGRSKFQSVRNELTEEELISQGYYKVYDCGKIKWLLDCEKK